MFISKCKPAMVIKSYQEKLKFKIYKIEIN
jgi:hypothetical protein